VSVDELDLLQKKFEGGVRGVCRFKPKRIEARGGARAHRRWRILPGKLADERTSDEEFVQPGGLVRGEEGRGVRGGCGVLIGAVLMAITREKSTGEGYSGDRFQKRRKREEIAGGGR
jgi:hypothetical protein